MPCSRGLHEGDEAELGDEAVVVGGELAVDAAGEHGDGQLALQVESRLAAPAVTLLEPRQRARSREPAH